MNDELIHYQTPTWKAREECWKHRKLYYYTCSIALLLAFLSYWLTPSRYTAQVKVADEYIQTDILLGLNRAAALIKKSLPTDNEEGLNNPEIYAQILSSRAFCERLSTIAVDDSTNYYQHLSKKVRQSWSDRLCMWLTDEDEYEYIIDQINDNIKFSVSPKYSSILIQAEDYQAKTAAIIVDSARVHLQNAISKFHLRKKEQDLKSAIITEQESKKNYLKALSKYAHYADAHSHSADQHVTTTIKKLNDDAKALYEIYQDKSIAKERARALLQQASPSFTTLVNVSVPQNPSKPLLLVNILLYLFLSIVFTSWYILYQRSYGKERST